MQARAMVDKDIYVCGYYYYVYLRPLLLTRYLGHCDITSCSLLDVLTPLSDCRQEPVENMERRISGGSCMYWMDFYNESFVVGFYVLD